MNTISKKRKTPIYLQLREIIRSQIENGEYSPGSMILSENGLAKKYNINRQTVRNAISSLVKEGILIRIQGKGAFVTSNKVEEVLDSNNIFNLNINQTKEYYAKKEIKKIERESGKYFSTIFNLGDNDTIYYLKELIYYKDFPLKINEYYIPKNIIANFLEVDFSIFEVENLIRLNHNLMNSCSQKMEIVQLSKRDLRYLDVDSSVSIIKLKSSYYNINEKLILLKNSYTRTDKANFTISFKKQ